MWTQAAVLLLACYLWPAQAQGIWDNPIKFNTKAKDACTMIITGHGENTRLRLACQSKKRTYWCEYMGKPYTCGAYNKNPRHYFVQMMWTLRKFPNACQAPKQIKPHMCRKSTEESQMVFTPASFSQPSTEASSRTGQRLGGQPARPQQPVSTRPDSVRQPATKMIRVPQQRVRTTQKAAPQPTPPPAESNAKRIARQYCWRSLQGMCSVVVGWFRE